jgi:transcriptional regulator with XRE-family HTH domain
MCVGPRIQAVALISARRRSAEEYVSEDWSAVAAAINERMTALGLNQRQLAERSQVALSIVREIAHNTVQRRRAGRTLEALSVALGCHPRHLAAILLGQQPPRPEDPIDYGADGVPARLAAIEDQLAEITKRLDEMNANITTVIDRARADRDR